ncbi:MAG TPA: FAD:protein FMN transferase [Symbiobacteriaceae bacterium]|nr:FAD:protein FMN transferase [Symbiobacteriaceae bacterium]
MIRQSWRKAALHMDTVVRMTVVTSQPEWVVASRLERAFQAFGFVEQVCSRFSAQSEMARLSLQVGNPTRVSELLFQALGFALEMAEDTGGAFDPTVGRRMEVYGFNRNYLSGERRDSQADPDGPVSYRDVVLNEVHHTVLLRKPLALDLGAVAKGLAVDLAARELAPFEGFLIDAGGDIYAGGLNECGEPWTIGVRHPTCQDGVICRFRLTDMAVCTSGSYERPSPIRTDAHHLIDPRSGAAPSHLLSCTVVAPFAMLADATSTAAFILGREKGMAYLDATGLDGLFIGPSLEMHITNSLMKDVLA